MRPVYSAFNETKLHLLILKSLNFNDIDFKPGFEIVKS
jgi:hypothetical protein